MNRVKPLLLTPIKIQEINGIVHVPKLSPKNSLEVTCTIKTKMQVLKTEKEFSVNDRNHSPGTAPYHCAK